MKVVRVGNVPKACGLKKVVMLKSEKQVLAEDRIV